MNISKLDGLTKWMPKIFTEGGNPQPQRDWLLITAVGLIALLGGSVWSYWSTLSNDAATASEVVSSGNDLRTNDLQNVQAIFAKREAARTPYQTTYHFVDPSR